MNQLKEQIEREAERYLEHPFKDLYQDSLLIDSVRKAIIHGANFALGLDRWVKVEDGLPGAYAETPNCSIDCLITDGVIADTAYLKYSINTWIVCSTQKPFTGDPVTHWQPLKLPK